MSEKRSLKKLGDALEVLESGQPLPSVDELAEQGAIEIEVEHDIKRDRETCEIFATTDEEWRIESSPMYYVDEAGELVLGEDGKPLESPESYLAVVDEDCKEIASFDDSEEGHRSRKDGAVMKGLAVGRIVHYVDEGLGIHLAAIVNTVYEGEADKGMAGLTVFDPLGNRLKRGVYFDEKKSRGTWHWPERVD